MRMQNGTWMNGLLCDWLTNFLVMGLHLALSQFTSNTAVSLWSGCKEKKTLKELYSWKIWRGIKFGGLADCLSNRQIKSTKISYSHIYVWQSHTKPPNLSPPIRLRWKFGTQPPNLIPTNISGYTVYLNYVLLLPFMTLPIKSSIVLATAVTSQCTLLMLVLVLLGLHTVKKDVALSSPTSYQRTVIRHPQSRDWLQNRRNSNIKKI